MSLPLKYLDSHKRKEMYQVQLGGGGGGDASCKWMSRFAGKYWSCMYVSVAHKHKIDNSMDAVNVFHYLNSE